MYYAINGLALIVNSIINHYELKKEKIPFKKIYTIIILEIIGLVLGSKTLDLIVNFNKYLYYDLPEIINTGFMFYGGIIYVIVIIAIYCNNKNININKVFNVIIPNILPLYAICKIGCFLNNCCTGINNLPIQLIESIASLGTYIILLKKSNPIRISCSCIIFGVIRFIAILLRDNMDISNIVVNEIISIIIIVYGISVLKHQKNYKKGFSRK